MDTAELQKFVVSFIELAVVSVLIEDVDEKEHQYLNSKGMLGMWAQLPDCQLSSMFLGYVMGQGVDINTFTPRQLEQAVIAAAGGQGNVDFDWIGDCDATDKPH